MTLPEIANRLVQLCKAHQNFDAMRHRAYLPVDRYAADGERYGKRVPWPMRSLTWSPFRARDSQLQESTIA